MQLYGNPASVHQASQWGLRFWLHTGVHEACICFMGYTILYVQLSCEMCSNHQIANLHAIKSHLKAYNIVLKCGFTLSSNKSMSKKKICTYVTCAHTSLFVWIFIWFLRCYSHFISGPLKFYTNVACFYLTNEYGVCLLLLLLRHLCKANDSHWYMLTRGILNS